MKIALLLLLAWNLHAQLDITFPTYLRPGARVRFPAFYETSRPTITVTATGKEYLLKRVDALWGDDERLPPLLALLLRRGRSWDDYLIPHDLPPGFATIHLVAGFDSQVLVGGQPYDEIYTLTKDSKKYPAALAQQQTANGPLRRNRLTDPARPGDRITLWGTGFDRASVTVAGTPIEAALAHQSDGLDRIEFTLPEDTPADCSLPVSVNQTAIAISTVELGGTVCPHRLGITPPDLLNLDRGGPVPMATFQFRPKSITVGLGDLTLAEVSAPVQFVGKFSAGCNVAAIPSRVPDMRGTLDINVNGFPRPELISPNGVRYTSKILGTNSYEFSSPTGGDIWIAGTWTFRSTFWTTSELKIVARTPLRFTNAPDFANFTRDRDFLLNWDPSLGAASEAVTFEHTQLSERPVDGIQGHKLTCREPIPSGRLTVPGQLLRTIQWLPAALRPTTSASPDFQPSISRAPDGRYIYVSY